MMGIQAVTGNPPNMQLVENYIKVIPDHFSTSESFAFIVLAIMLFDPIKIQAFYLPETEYVHWAKTHSVSHLQISFNLALFFLPLILFLFFLFVGIHKESNSEFGQLSGHNESLAVEK